MALPFFWTPVSCYLFHWGSSQHLSLLVSLITLPLPYFWGPFLLPGALCPVWGGRRAECLGFMHPSSLFPRYRPWLHSLTFQVCLEMGISTVDLHFFAPVLSWDFLFPALHIMIHFLIIVRIIWLKNPFLEFGGINFAAVGFASLIRDDMRYLLSPFLLHSTG